MTVKACFECEEIAEGQEELDCDHKVYRYSEHNKWKIDFVESEDLKFGEEA